MTLGDLLANGKPHAGSFVSASSMEPLEGSKDPIQVLLVKAYAIVLNGDLLFMLMKGIRLRRIDGQGAKYLPVNNSCYAANGITAVV
jgi:hypothetical protein